MKNINNSVSLFSCRGNVSSDVAKGVSPIFGSEATRHLLFDLDHADIPFGLIIVEGD